MQSGGKHTEKRAKGTLCDNVLQPPKQIGQEGAGSEELLPREENVGQEVGSANTKWDPTTCVQRRQSACLSN